MMRCCRTCLYGMPTGYLDSQLSSQHNIEKQTSKVAQLCRQNVKCYPAFHSLKNLREYLFFLATKKLWICLAQFRKFYHVTKKNYSQSWWLSVITSYSRSTICRVNSNDISARETSDSCLRMLRTLSTFYLISAESLLTEKCYFDFFVAVKTRKGFFCVKLRVACGNDNIKLRLKRPFHSSWFSLFETAANDKIPTVICWN